MLDPRVTVSRMVALEDEVRSLEADVRELMDTLHRKDAEIASLTAERDGEQVINPGHLIVLEGIDGAGKSIQLSHLSYQYAPHHNFVFVREPGSTPEGEACRDLLKRTDLTGEERILLYTVARSSLCRQVIRPAILAGKTVICDRYLPSMLAYQGWNTYFSHKDILSLFRTTRGIAPSLVIYIDISVKTSLLRRRDSHIEDGLDPTDADFLTRVRQEYLKLAEAPDWITVNGELPEPEVRYAVYNAVENFLDSHRPE